jgi:hypothetical protein
VGTDNEYGYEHFHPGLLFEDMAFRTGPAPGERMPAFDLPTTDGARVTTSELLRRGPFLLTLGSAT